MNVRFKNNLLSFSTGLYDCQISNSVPIRIWPENGFASCAGAEITPHKHPQFPHATHSQDSGGTDAIPPGPLWP
jgi:hypothetical protein